MYDFVSLIYVYNEFISTDVVKEKRFKQLKEFFDTRVVKNREYFIKNECIKSAYRFLKKVVDYVNK